MTMTDNPRAVIGDNRAPDFATRISDELRQQYAETERRVADIVGRAEQALEITDDETMGAAAKIIKDADDEDRRLEKLREAEKMPYYRAGQVIDNFFKSLKLKLRAQSRADKPGTLDILRLNLNAYNHRKLVAEQCQSHRARTAYEARKEIRAARVGNQADLRERLDERCGARGNHQIARERDVRASAGGDAVDGTDDRERKCANAKNERLVVALDRRPEIDRRFARQHGAVGQVLARAKPPSGAGEQQHARRRVGFDPLERVANLRVHRVVEAVQPIGPIERKARDAVFGREQDVFVVHGCPVQIRNATLCVVIAVAALRPRRHPRVRRVRTGRATVQGGLRTEAHASS